jgi:hypothetical protein
MHKKNILFPAVFIFMFLFSCLSLSAGTALQQKIDLAIHKIRQNPLDFSAWLEFRAQNRAKGTPEKNIARYEPIFLAVCDKSENTMILAAVIMPGKDSSLHDVNAPGNNTPAKLREIAGYIKMLDWYSADGRKLRFENPKIITRKLSPEGDESRLSLGSCSGEIISTCPAVSAGEVNELDQNWIRMYLKAKRAKKGMSRLAWQFLTKNKLVWGIGYEITEQDMLPGQPVLREARIELISRTSSGSCRVKL